MKICLSLLLVVMLFHCSCINRENSNKNGSAEIASELSENEGSVQMNNMDTDGSSSESTDTHNDDTTLLAEMMDINTDTPVFILPHENYKTGIIQNIGFEYGFEPDFQNGNFSYDNFIHAAAVRIEEIPETAIALTLYDRNDARREFSYTIEEDSIGQYLCETDKWTYLEFPFHITAFLPDTEWGLKLEYNDKIFECDDIRLDTSNMYVSNTDEAIPFRGYQSQCFRTGELFYIYDRIPNFEESGFFDEVVIVIYQVNSEWTECNPVISFRTSLDEEGYYRILMQAGTHIETGNYKVGFGRDPDNVQIDDLNSHFRIE
jgi:hypothetical protein